MKINANNIIETASGLLLAGGVIAGAFLVAQKFFGLFAYPNVSKEYMNQVIQNIDENYMIISRVQGSRLFGGTFVRGIVGGNFGPMYYHRYEYSADGNPESVFIYPLIMEQYQREPALFDINSVF